MQTFDMGFTAQGFVAPMDGFWLPIAGDNATRIATLPFSDTQGTIGIPPFLETRNGPSRQASPIDTRMSSVSPSLPFARPVHPGLHGRMASIGSVMSQTFTSSTGNYNANLEASIGRMTISPPPASPRPTQNVDVLNAFQDVDLDMGRAGVAARVHQHAIATSQGCFCAAVVTSNFKNLLLNGKVAVGRVMIRVLEISREYYSNDRFICPYHIAHLGGKCGLLVENVGDGEPIAQLV
ncbi:hypothetical protein EMCG_00467 [[Emmonsia] crescens]|uniref:Uncharacterized protein n=1 Tax=[Emmonsia] crescens TaxID=73230 RepID=A0A0G2HVB8_9EURO|nr:hypothetical protein EMCG_00467 [Emmonsia crescens UAMH 3008]